MKQFIYYGILPAVIGFFITSTIGFWANKPLVNVTKNENVTIQVSITSEEIYKLPDIPPTSVIIGDSTEGGYTMYSYDINNVVVNYYVGN